MSRRPPQANTRTKETWGLKALKTHRSVAEDRHSGLQRGKSKPAVGGGEDLNLPLPKCSQAVSPDSHGE